MRLLSLRIKILAVHVWFKAPACRGPIRYKNLSYVIPYVTGQLIERVAKVDCRLVSTEGLVDGTTLEVRIDDLVGGIFKRRFLVHLAIDAYRSKQLGENRKSRA